MMSRKIGAVVGELLITAGVASIAVALLGYDVALFRQLDAMGSGVAWTIRIAAVAVGTGLLRLSRRRPEADS